MSVYVNTNNFCVTFRLLRMRKLQAQLFYHTIIDMQRKIESIGWWLVSESSSFLEEWDQCAFLVSFARLRTSSNTLLTNKHSGHRACASYLQ